MRSVRIPIAGTLPNLDKYLPEASKVFRSVSLDAGVLHVVYDFDPALTETTMSKLIIKIGDAV